VIYVTKAGDRLDRICRRTYGHLSGTVEAVLAANPGLSGQPAVLPEGVGIELPTLPEVRRAPKKVALW